MSKDPDVKDDLDPTKPRKRRKGGLRVPEDNVPRRAGQSGPIASPSPEDPHLAVSVAYDFGADDGRSPPNAEVSADYVETDELPVLVEIRADDDIEGRVTEPSAARPNGEGAGPPAAVPAHEGRRLTADSVDIPFDDEDEPVQPPDGDHLAASAVPRRIPRAKTMALAESDLEELIDDDGALQAAREGGRARLNRQPSFDLTAPTPKVEIDAALESEATTVEHDPSLARAPTGPVTVEVAAEAATPRPREASDSGEILTEELIEELDDNRRAAAAVAVPTAVAPVSAPPAPAPVAAGPAASASAAALDDEDDDEALEVEEVRTEDVVPAASAAAARAVTEPPPPPIRPPAAASAAPAVAKPKPPPAPAAARAAAVAAAADATQARPRKRRGKPWFEEIFDEDYLRTLPFLTPQATQLEANFVMESLGVDPGSQVLDLGCGYGRHAMELAARGYHVVGLDSSLPLLLRGADEAQRRGLTINFVHGDMRDISFDSQFDGAYCLFSTFGYFDDETNKRTASNIARALKPGARCVFEVLNRDYIIGDLPSRVWWEGDGCVVLEEVDFNYFSSRIVSNRSVVFDDGRQLEQEISIRSFSLHELGKLLHSAGFRVIEVSGSMATRGRYFGACSRDIVVVAERRAERPGPTAELSKP